jgi:hypothetical protein
LKINQISNYDTVKEKYITLKNNYLISYNLASLLYYSTFIVIIDDLIWQSDGINSLGEIILHGVYLYNYSLVFIILALTTILIALMFALIRRFQAYYADRFIFTYNEDRTF